MNNQLLKRKTVGTDTLVPINEIIYWNSVPVCSPTDCACVNMCGRSEEGEPCTVVKAYISNAIDVMVDTFRNKLTPELSFKLGQHLIPLYSQLCKLKMAEFERGDVLVPGSAPGSTIINPLFSEIRKCISAIEKSWKALGVDIEKKSNVSSFNQRSNYDVIESGGLPILED